ncbi:MAG: AzlC family ABC transporter permease [Treponema sp.]|nr:AzlC family ABC transporter permease [Treponema sp.]
MIKPAGNTVFWAAFKYSIPVLLGYFAIGTAFGLLMSDAGYPWWLSLAMSLFMFAGAGQFMALGLFAAGTGIWEAALVQLVLNARHIAYGFSMLKKFSNTGLLKYYLIFGMTDETFALLSSLNDEESAERKKFMVTVTALDHLYWTSGTLTGAFIGSIIPFNTDGIGYALTALFVVLLVEQILRVRRPAVFIVSAVIAVLAVFILPARISLLAAIVLALGISSFFSRHEQGELS